MLVNDGIFRRLLMEWFDVHRRELPWRRVKGGAAGGVGGAKDLPLDPYAVLVSEAMLQQTQVATVVPYYERWMARFPTLSSLARAEEGEVLKMWEGLGYYSRARNLQKAAKAIVGELGGVFPKTAEALKELPGVGPYTAGAIASIAFDEATPLVDGNVLRVLTRLEGYRGDPRGKEGTKWLWERAGELVPRERPGDFNSALMELGATVCSPKKPACLMCPVARACVAREKGLQGEIPPAKAAKETPHFSRDVYCLRRSDGMYLLEQRPGTGRWAGMWQFVTVDPSAGGGKPVKKAEVIGEVEHALTHRRYTFTLWFAEVVEGFGLGGERATAWVKLDGLEAYAMPKPHVKAVRVLKERGGGGL